MAFNGQETKKTVRQRIKEHSPCTHTRNFYEWITNEIEQDSRLLLHSSLCVSCFSVGCLHFRFFFLHINKASVRAAHSPQKDINSEKMTAEKRHNENSNHMWLQFLCVILLVANVSFSHSLSLFRLYHQANKFSVRHTRKNRIYLFLISECKSFHIQAVIFSVERKSRTEIWKFAERKREKKAK